MGFNGRLSAYVLNGRRYSVYENKKERQRQLAYKGYYRVRHNGLRAYIELLFRPFQCVILCKMVLYAYTAHVSYDSKGHRRKQGRSEKGICACLCSMCDIYWHRSASDKRKRRCILWQSPWIYWTLLHSGYRYHSNDNNVGRAYLCGRREEAWLHEDRFCNDGGCGGHLHDFFYRIRRNPGNWQHWLYQQSHKRWRQHQHG